MNGVWWWPEPEPTTSKGLSREDVEYDVPIWEEEDIEDTESR